MRTPAHVACAWQKANPVDFSAGFVVSGAVCQWRGGTAG